MRLFCTLRKYLTLFIPIVFVLVVAIYLFGVDFWFSECGTAATPTERVERYLRAKQKGARRTNFINSLSGRRSNFVDHLITDLGRVRNYFLFKHHYSLADFDYGGQMHFYGWAFHHVFSNKKNDKVLAVKLRDEGKHAIVVTTFFERFVLVNKNGNWLVIEEPSVSALASPP